MNKSLVIASLIAAAPLAACGKKEEPAPAPAPVAVEPAAAPAAPASEAAAAATDAAAAATDAASAAGVAAQFQPDVGRPRRQPRRVSAPGVPGAVRAGRGAGRFCRDRRLAAGGDGRRLSAVLRGIFAQRQPPGDCGRHHGALAAAGASALT